MLDVISDQTIAEASLLSFTATASDSDTPINMLVFTLGDESPVGATIDEITGDFRWQPSELQGPGEYPITVMVTDTGDPRLSDSQEFTVTVAEVNRPHSSGMFLM